MGVSKLGLVIVLGCTTATVPPPMAPAPPPAKPAVVEPTLSTGMPAGYVEMHADQVVTMDDGSGALLLVDEASNRALPIVIGGTEAASIAGRLNGTKPPRPLTHDLLDHLLVKLHATLVKVQVDELRRDGEGGGVFVGSIFVRASGRVIQLDARPSDAIALAIGNKVPIYVATKVLDEAPALPWDQLKQRLVAPVPGQVAS